MSKRKSVPWKERLAQSLQIPRDLICQESVITLMGAREILVENYRGISWNIPKIIF